MMRPIRSSRLLAFSLALGVALPSAVWADGARDKVLEITKAALVANGAKEITLGAVEGDDARFSLTGTKIVSEHEGKIGTLTVGKTTWVGAVPTADGGYSADEVTAEGLDFDADDAKLKADKIVATKYKAQAPAKIVPGKMSGERVEQVAATGLVMTTEDGKVIPIQSIAFSSSDWVGDAPHKGSFELKGLVVPLDPKDEEVAQLRALGYDKVTLDVAASGAWDDKAGRLDIPALTISAADMGALKISATIGGVTPEVVEGMKKAEGDQAKQMELLQALSVEALALRWDDASLAPRLIGMQAKQQGVDSKTYAKQLKLLLPAVLSMIGNKDFEKKVATAAGAFLETPKSLTVAARPKTPVPFGQIMGAAMMAPQSLPNVLSVEVVAND
ncbi:MAG: hypothetical protein LWW93_05105 [Hyphomicrobiales bacterium]|nr:hypothetical protein [Hyphomicrobiales bacterium]